MTNIYELLKTPVQLASWQGAWTRVWSRPDVFSAQEYIVGAIALDGDVVHDFRVLSGADRLACIYGDETKPMFEQTLAELREALADARAAKRRSAELTLPHCFRLEHAGSLRTQKPGESLDRMLRDGTIPLEPEEPVGQRPRFTHRRSVDVVQEVLDRVKVRAGLPANRFLREEHFADQAHQVGVNLVTDHAAGIVASGWYADPDRIQLEFLLAASKVEAYVAATQKETAALFFRRPTIADGLSPANWREVEDKLGELEWRLEKKGARVVTTADADAMASEVVAWAEEFA